MNELIELLRLTNVDDLIDKYNVEFYNKTMIINKKIPVKDFIRLRENIRKRYTIDNIIVDGDR
jgi:hypothetical protein